MKHAIALILVFIVTFGNTPPLYADSVSVMSESVLELAKESLQKNNIPGAYVAVISENQDVLGEGYGYADLSKEAKVDENTLFEIGSNSKAFTALAILALEQEGKVKLDAAVSQYIPWFYAMYEGKKESLTIKQLLHHTTGIPFHTIDQIPADNSPDALERTVRHIAGVELDRRPGEQFQYSTINYDILGLVIEEVSGTPYEAYMKEHIFQPLGLHNTQFYSQLQDGMQVAKSYKRGFFHPIEYTSPKYRGNAPAGYIISNGHDMGRWLKIQLGLAEDIPDTFKELIKKSHEADRTVGPAFNGSSYAFGWNVYQAGQGEIAHAGENPTFSSYVGLLPGDQSGIVILANINSAAISNTGENILNLIRGKEITSNASDLYTRVDFVASLSIFILGLLGLYLTYQVLSLIFELIRRQRSYKPVTASTIVGIVSLISFSIVLSIGLYLLPNVLFNEMSWPFVLVWGPVTILIAVLMALASIWIYTLMFILSLLFPKKGDNAIFSLILISLLSGFGNAFIIFVVNISLSRNNFSLGLVVYFAIGLILYVVGQKFLRTRLIRFTNDTLFVKKKEITNTILNSTYQKIEKFGKEKIYPVLNNDTETISGSINIVIGGLTSFVTLICCFIYLGFINFYGLLVSLAVIIMTSGFYYFFARHAHRVWEQTRDIQNKFFKIIDQLLEGFKELSLHHKKRVHFQKGAVDIYDSYRVKRSQGDIAFANVFVIGELLFTLVIGCAIFIFPVLFPDLNKGSISNYVFVFLYMTGPVNGLLNAVPEFTRIRISLNRINELLQELRNLKVGVSCGEQIKREVKEIQLVNISYQYNNDGGFQFVVGPLSYTFRAGETTFITGGNGSGKSTLGKLLTGLYEPHEGQILINGEAVNPNVLGEYYSAIFTDFYLFDHLYGIDTYGREAEIRKYLEMMQLQDKVEIAEDGRVSNTNLSTGQRKRLALLNVYLDNRPICFFDEWAADQDPEFRHFFYNRLLPDMKANGKCIIAITHDDAYFGTADNIIKLELGKIVQEKPAVEYGLAKI
ncbi:MAG: cyclic peptide export ABC transporter [Paenibacillus dendritiformis]|uniref:cyclic peptide export ABC transporter n=1 Tax=uncultured Paenibacillus sp. TaxID=227322 RepID=UPI0025DD4EEA|nr:cyclic peptide export ABC transporter [uncultured Paenibacillus sp.]MDU5141927.1 cyclic peptide export ABC transporter [Paenibacillus dendritiformis]